MCSTLTPYFLQWTTESHWKIQYLSRIRMGGSSPCFILSFSSLDGLSMTSICAWDLRPSMTFSDKRICHFRVSIKFAFCYLPIWCTFKNNKWQEYLFTAHDICCNHTSCIVSQCMHLDSFQTWMERVCNGHLVHVQNVFLILSSKTTFIIAMKSFILSSVPSSFSELYK